MPENDNFTIFAHVVEASATALSQIGFLNHVRRFDSYRGYHINLKIYLSSDTLSRTRLCIFLTHDLRPSGAAM